MRFQLALSGIMALTLWGCERTPEEERALAEANAKQAVLPECRGKDIGSGVIVLETSPTGSCPAVTSEEQLAAYLKDHPEKQILFINGNQFGEIESIVVQDRPAA